MANQARREAFDNVDNYKLGRRAVAETIDKFEAGPDEIHRRNFDIDQTVVEAGVAHDAVKRAGSGAETAAQRELILWCAAQAAADE